METITRHPPGQLPATFTPGDFGLVRDWKEDALGELIQAGERADLGPEAKDPEKLAYANLTHSFGIVDTKGGIVEANAGGIERQHITKYLNADFYIVHVDATPEQRALCVARWEANVGVGYDKLDFVGLALSDTLGWPISIHSSKKMFICSGYVSYGLLAHVVDFLKPIETMKPADLAIKFNLVVTEAPVALGFFARFLDGFRTAGRLFGRMVSNLVGVFR